MIDATPCRDLSSQRVAEDEETLRQGLENSVKGDFRISVRKARKRYVRHARHDEARLTAFCEHPFHGLASDLKTAYSVGDKVRSDRALGDLLSAFSDWISELELAHEASFGNERMLVEWWPVEMLEFLTTDLSPQLRAQIELGNHLLECLDLIRLATVSGPEFLSLWINSNEPFFAAGRFYHGTVRWVREVPTNGNHSALESEFLLERVADCAREYVGLMRLALLAGAESPLLERIAFVLRRFKLQYACEIPAWQGLANELLDGLDDVPIHTAIARPPHYDEIDRVCVRLRQSLVKASRGLEDEIPALINALLPTLEIPSSSVLFQPQKR